MAANMETSSLAHRRGGRVRSEPERAGARPGLGGGAGPAALLGPGGHEMALGTRAFQKMFVTIAAA